jgi:hypothetical protein
MHALYSEDRFVSQDPAEFDFRDFRWAKMERLRRGDKFSMNGIEDESLLEYKVSKNNMTAPLTTATTATPPSPRLDAIDISSSAAWYSASVSRLKDGTASENATMNPNLNPLENNGIGDELEFTLDYWPWPLEQSTNVEPNGGPLTFWSHLQPES